MAGFDDDCVSNLSSNESFEQVLEARLSRRGVLGAGATAAAVGGIGALLSAVPARADDGEPRLRR